MMSAHIASAIAHPNIAFIKYWGNQDNELRIPANSSISMNLAGLTTRTQVTFDPLLESDSLTLNGRELSGLSLRRTSSFLDRVRQLSGLRLCARVESENNFPTGVGIASSASAFAALAMAASAAAGLELDEADLSRLARLGSGSACRSIPGGFVEWQAGERHESSFAFSIAPPKHWDLVDCVAVVSKSHKPTGSTEGHAMAGTSPLHAARLEQVPALLEACRKAIQERDFETFGQVVEQDCTLMHAVMMTSDPPLFYWQPVTLAVMYAVHAWRKKGRPVCYTIDAGPNVHVLCPASEAPQVAQDLHAVPGVEQVLTAGAGGRAKLVEDF